MEPARARTSETPGPDARTTSGTTPSDRAAADVARSRVARLAAWALPRGGRALLAVSGGSDSVALLAAAREALPGAVFAVHVRHGLRPDDGRDARLVEALCRELDVPCRVVRAPPEGGDAARTETAARRRRLAVLERVAREAGCAAVLAAHHADDARETMLLHLMRGHRGDRALAAIPSVRRLPAGTPLLRPFVIGARAPGRADLAAARVARGLPCLEDPTNADVRIARNAVRAMLARAGPDLAARLDGARGAAQVRLSARVRSAAEALERGLVAEGLGAVIAREAFEAPGDAAAVRAHRVELLRLLGACLARPRRVDPRGRVLDALDRALVASRVRLTIPAAPAPLACALGPDGMHLAHERLTPGPPAARSLGAVAAGSLYV